MGAPESTLLRPPGATSLPRLRWWREVLTASVFYGLYSVIRDLYASTGGKTEAIRNAHWVIRAERDLHIFYEQQMQHAFLGWRLFIIFWNTWYGTMHFVAVAVALVVLFRRHPDRYPLWRNTFALMNVIALLGFSLFPLAPPRLLPLSFHFVDTLDHFGSPWDFSSGPAAEASNQFAAMPSMHTGWSAWAALALLPLIRPWWGKVALLTYPAVTVFCIVLTGNHYFLDAVGGLVSLGLAYTLARPLTAWWSARTWMRRPALPSSDG